MSELDKKWGHVIDTYDSNIHMALLRALESASHMGVGIITVKKDRNGGYIIQNKLWADVDSKERLLLRDELKKLGALGPFGGDPADHKGE